MEEVLYALVLVDQRVIGLPLYNHPKFKLVMEDIHSTSNSSYGNCRGKETIDEGLKAIYLLNKEDEWTEFHINRGNNSTLKKSS